MLGRLGSVNLELPIKCGRVDCVGFPTYHIDVMKLRSSENALCLPIEINRPRFADKPLSALAR